MIVTTFSPEGYELYGKRFVETYKKHCNYPLIIYVEDDLKIEGVETRSLFDIPGCKLFLERVKDFKPDNYRMDVNKFCRKVFAMTDLKTGEQFAFIGADTVFHKDIPASFLRDVLGDSHIAYLGRSGMHSETDFIAFDGLYTRTFLALFRNMYLTGAFRDLQYWCDSDVFDHLMTLLMPPSRNLNEIDDHTHPFVNSMLGEYMDHLKGPIRKQAGRSFERDYANQ